MIRISFIQSFQQANLPHTLSQLIRKQQTAILPRLLKSRAVCREHKLPDEMHLRMRQSPASGCALRLLTGATLPLTRADSACVLRVPVLAESYLTHELEDRLGVSPLLRCLQALE